MPVRQRISERDAKSAHRELALSYYLAATYR